MERGNDYSPRAEPYRDPESFSLDAQGLKLTFYASGEDRLAAVLDMIREARESLKLYYYMFAADACAAKVRDTLVEAAARGVAVTLIVDDFGSSAKGAFLAPLADAGGIVRRFSSHWSARYLIRNHQKMLIMDDRVALIGGFNIAEDYFAPPDKNGWNDLGVRVEGDAVKNLAEWFALLDHWTSQGKVRLLQALRQVRGWNSGSGTVRWLIGGPSRRLGPWARCVIEDIAHARKLDMMVAYFSPRRGLVGRIGQVAERARLARAAAGADRQDKEGDGARLLLAAKSDNTATVGAARANYGRMLRRGVEIHEFEPCKLHAKLVVVDDAVYIGSANFDMRSLYLNLELMLRVEDAALADRMREFIAWHLPYATEVTPALHRRRRTWWNRVRWTISWYLVTVVDYTVTRRLNLGQ